MAFPAFLLCFSDLPQLQHRTTVALAATVFRSDDRPVDCNMQPLPASQWFGAATGNQQEKGTIPMRKYLLAQLPRPHSRPRPLASDGSRLCRPRGRRPVPEDADSVDGASTSPTPAPADFARHRRRAASSTRTAMTSTSSAATTSACSGSKASSATSTPRSRASASTTRSSPRSTPVPATTFIDERLRPQRPRPASFGMVNGLLDFGGNGGVGGYVGGGVGYASVKQFGDSDSKLRMAAARRRLHAGQRQHRYRPEVSLLPHRQLNSSTTRSSFTAGATTCGAVHLLGGRRDLRHRRPFQLAQPAGEPGLQLRRRPRLRRLRLRRRRRRRRAPATQTCPDGR